MTPHFWRALALGALQGATEFLPVSSSGHLIIVPEILGWPASSLTFDVVVHWATALAVMLYFKADWTRLLRSAGRSARAGRRMRNPGPGPGPETQLLFLLVLATIPAMVAGLAAKGAFDATLASNPRGMARFAALMLLVTGGLLLVSENLARRRARSGKAVTEVDAGSALGIGLAQALAIAPGISRSGATIAAGLTVDLEREDAARFSFLLAAPIMVVAGVFEMATFALERPTSDDALAMVAGFAAAFAIGYLAIDWLLRFVRRAPLYVFVAYTWFFGLLSLWLLR